jgi:hypothetical protein
MNAVLYYSCACVADLASRLIYMIYCYYYYYYYYYSFWKLSMTHYFLILWFHMLHIHNMQCDA